MTNEALQNTIASWFENKLEANLVFSTEGSQFLNVEIDTGHLHELMSFLKVDKDMQFDYLFCLTGVDWNPELGVIYHLESTSFRHQLVVRVKISNRENPEIDSVQDLWATANFHEREVFDFFGITFNNHPKMKRLFLTDDWEGYPLRKDYVDEVNMITK
jgi:NADH-quinone oxidoreductase subunit C